MPRSFLNGAKKNAYCKYAIVLTHYTISSVHMGRLILVRILKRLLLLLLF